mgnify:CR=1 FL=1
MKKEEIEKIYAEQTEHPETRIAQKTLAWEVVKDIHGKDEADNAVNVSVKLFQGDFSGLSVADIKTGMKSVPSFDLKEAAPLIDVLVNNAGFGQYGAVENVSTEDARRQFDVNVFGLARLCRLVLPGMRERKAGRIINVASMAGHFCEPHGGWYHASKYAVVGLTGCLRQEVRNFGIEVIKIEPGEIRSEWSGIAMQNLCNSSKGTAYEKGALRQSRLYAFGEKHLATDPMAVAKAIAAAATCRRPRLTYRTGFGCIGLSLASAILPQRWFDAILIRLFT